MNDPNEKKGGTGAVRSLERELDEARIRASELEDTRRAMLNLLEDVNEVNETLKRGKREIEAVFDGIDSPIFVHDSEMRILRCNEAYRRAAGIPYREILSRRHYEVFPKTGGPTEGCVKSMEGARAGIGAKEIVHVEPCDKLYMVRSYALKTASEHGEFIHILDDVTEEERAKEKLNKANRLYATLSQINQAIVRERDEQKLFQEICNVIVEFGRFRLAWIGLIDEENQLVEPAAFSGEGSDYLQKIKISLAGDSNAKGPTGLSIRDGKSVVFNDLEDNPDFAPWREQALAKGYRSSAAFPIRLHNRVIGALNVYAAEPHFFDEEETILLDEAAVDICFALETIEEEKNRRRAEESLMESEAQLSMIYQSVGDVLFSIGVEPEDCFRFLSVNQAFLDATGLKEDQIVGKRIEEVIPEPSVGMVRDNYKKAIRDNRTVRWEETSVFPAGEKVGDVSITPVLNAKGVCTNLIGSVHDITERRRAEDKERRLYELSVKIAEDMDLGYRLGEICAAVVSLGYHTVWIGKHDKESRRILKRASMQAPETGFDCVCTADSSVCEAQAIDAVKTGIYKVVNNISCKEAAGPSGPCGADRRCSTAAFPIKDGDKVLGVLNVCVRGESFPEREISFLRIFTAQASIWIKNSILFKEVGEYAGRVKKEMALTKNLLDLSDATFKTTDLDVLMDKAVKCVKKITDCDTVLSYLWDMGSKVMRPARFDGLSNAGVALFATEPVDMKGFLSAGDAFKGNTVMVIRKGSSPAERAGGLLEFFLRFVPDLATLVMIPLVGKLHNLGLLVMVYNTANPKSKRDILESEKRLKLGIANQVSTALEEASLYRESVDQTMELSHRIKTIEIMHEIDKKVLSTLESQEILNIATSMIPKIITCDRATVIIVDREKEGFTFKAGVGEGFTARGRTVPFRLTKASEILKTHSPQYIPDLKAIKGPLLLEKSLIKEGFGSVLRMPVIVKGEVTGVLCLGSRMVSAFDARDLSTLERLASHIGTALENARLVGDLEDLFMGTVKALSNSIDIKSPWTMGHSERVTEIALEIAKRMGVEGEDIKNFQIAGLLHDIGKLSTYEDILNKQGKLTDEEFALIRQHPEKGAEILSPIKQLRNVIPVVKYHHEHFDGRGYPEGIEGEDIPFLARILAVADTVDAMSSDRPYRKGKPMETIVEELKRCAGTQFDPRVVDAFLSASFVQAPGG